MSVTIETIEPENAETFIKNMLKEYDEIAKSIGFEDAGALEEFKFDAWQGMIKFGGSFVEMLGHALARADMHNTKKIISTFKDYCIEHAAIYRKHLENKETT